MNHKDPRLVFSAIVLAVFLSCANATEQQRSLESLLIEQLARYQGLSSPAALNAQVQLRTRLEDGKSKKHKSREGEIQLKLKDDTDGLALSFAAELMRLVNQEREHAVQKPDEMGPALIAFNEIDSSVLRDMADAATMLQRQINNAEFVGKESIECSLAACFVLHYRFGDERLSSSSKRFIKDFDGRLDITVDAAGRPLRATLTQRARGRAFVFIKFRSDADQVWDFAEAGNRLIATRHTRQRETEGGGERGLRWHDYGMSVDGVDAKPWMLCQQTMGSQDANNEDDDSYIPANDPNAVVPAC